MEGSTIQDQFGEGDSEGESMGASFDISPNGANVSISGLQAQNNYLIGPNSKFISTMKTKEGNTTKQNGDFHLTWEKLEKKSLKIRSSGTEFANILIT